MFTLHAFVSFLFTCVPYSYGLRKCWNNFFFSISILMILILTNFDTNVGDHSWLLVLFYLFFRNFLSLIAGNLHSEEENHSHSLASFKLNLIFFSFFFFPKFSKSHIHIDLVYTYKVVKGTYKVSYKKRLKKSFLISWLTDWLTDWRKSF